MSFLFPLYLLGALAIGLPILLHLRRRPPKEHVPFSSHMFLEKTPERLTRRTRIERWWLLALRCIALILLALVFGRPFLKDETLASASASGVRAIVLIDRSASMRRDDLWDLAVTEAVSAVEGFEPEDSVALATVGDRFEIVADFSNWDALSPAARANAAREMLSSGPTWSGTAMDDALTEAAERLESNAEESDSRRFAEKRIVLISDFQEGAERDALNQYAWPETVTVRPVELRPKSSNNLSLHLVAASSDDREDTSHRRVRVSNSPDGASAAFRLAWQGAPEDLAVTGTIPPGASRVLPVPGRDSDATDGTLVLSGDDYDFDNRVYLARAQPLPVSITFLSNLADADEAGSPFFYLNRALAATSTIEPTVSAATFDETDELNPEVTQVVVAHGVLSGERGKMLAAFAEAGGLVIAIPDGESVEGLQALTGLSEVTISEASVNDYAMLAGLDFDHPVLEPFARAGLRDFTRIHTWKHRQLTLPETHESVRVLATFDSGDPAWVEQRRGDGTVFLMLAGWEPRDSQLALSSKFVPLLYSILSRAGYSATAGKTLLVGSPIALRGERSITLPGGSEVALETESDVYTTTDEPGFYTVGDRIHALNLAASESRVDSVSPLVLLGDLGVNVVTEATALAAETRAAELSEDDQRRLEATEREADQKLWKWLALAVMVVLVFETWLAGRRRGGAVAAMG